MMKYSIILLLWIGMIIKCKGQTPHTINKVDHKNQPFFIETDSTHPIYDTSKKWLLHEIGPQDSVYRFSFSESLPHNMKMITIGPIKTSYFRELFFDSTSIVAFIDSNYKLSILDTGRFIKTLLWNDSVKNLKFDGWRKKYWALVDYIESEEYLERGHWNEPKKVKAYYKAWAKFDKLQKQWP